MKALTIHQPYASLIARGAKVYETRSWKTNYRGRIAIHAGKKSAYSVIYRLFPNTGEETAFEYEFIYAVREHLGDDFEDNVPYGAIIAAAELVNCYQIQELAGKTYLCGFVHGGELCNNELLFGDYTPGRFAWELCNIKVLEKPIPARGKQGLWEWHPPFDPFMGSGRIMLPKGEPSDFHN